MRQATRGTFTDLSQLIYSHYFKSFPLACQYPWGERGIVGVKKVSRLGKQQHGGQTLGMRKRSIIVGCTPISCAKVNGKHENNNKSRKISEKNWNFHRNLYKETKRGKRKPREFSNTKLIQVQVSCWFSILFWIFYSVSNFLFCFEFSILFWVLPERLYVFKTPWVTSWCGCL